MVLAINKSTFFLELNLIPGGFMGISLYFFGNNTEVVLPLPAEARSLPSSDLPGNNCKLKSFVL